MYIYILYLFIEYKRNTRTSDARNIFCINKIYVHYIIYKHGRRFMVKSVYTYYTYYI